METLNSWDAGSERTPTVFGRFRMSPIGPEVPVRNLALQPEDLLGPLNDLERRYAPAQLFVSGRLTSPLPHPRVSIVGTRAPSEDGLRAARRLASDLGRKGVTIVSGLARGIDTAAHTEAISVGARTIAVLGTPLSKTYPKENASLQQLIMTEHLAVSQFAEGYPTRPENFVLRNRTMALMSDATVIVESGEKGGALHQGWEAIRLGRPLFIRKSVVEAPGLTWPRDMQRYGAVEFDKPSEILDFVPESRPELIVDGVAES